MTFLAVRHGVQGGQTACFPVMVASLTSFVTLASY